MTSIYSPRWVEPEPPVTRTCDVPGCKEVGNYKAPKSRDSEKKRDYHWFCLEHVQAYNKAWNYFDGMSDNETEAFLREAATGHRKTWKRERSSTYTAENLHQSVRRGFADYFTGDDDVAASVNIAPVDRQTKKALAALDMEWPATESQVRKRYKELVKKYHPDVNKSKNAEDIFKRVTEAYQILKEKLKQ